MTASVVIGPVTLGRFRSISEDTQFECLEAAGTLGQMDVFVQIKLSFEIDVFP